MKLSETATPNGRWYLCEENNCMEMKIETLLAIMAKWNIIVAAHSEREQRYGDNPTSFQSGVLYGLHLAMMTTHPTVAIRYKCKDQTDSKADSLL